MQKIQIAIMKGTILILLAMGGCAAIFRHDLEAAIVSLVSVAALSVLSAMTLFEVGMGQKWWDLLALFVNLVIVVFSGVLLYWVWQSTQ